MSKITIQPIYDLDKMAEVEPVEQAIWGIADIEVTCTHTLHALVENGGSLIGAYDEGKLIGFVLGIPAFTKEQHLPLPERLKMYSYMAGVLPAYQGHGIGYRLKLAQREEALRQGYRLITWTYDPLESRNAHLNIGKLGATCRTYHRHFHGDLGGINAGLPTDRFNVDWWLDSEAVKEKIAEEKRSLRLGSGQALSLQTLITQGAVILNPAIENAAGLLVPPEAVAHPNVPSLVEIPTNFRALKAQDFALAETWRLHTRALFETAFNQGFVVTDFVMDEAENACPEQSRSSRFRSYYLLTKPKIED
ncbi:MAG: GNAT family N-acetyltransferase [Anaerolineae bacterium]|nr:GNAT family N-acetyltransferase [Anaerolineae bacterium]